MYVFFFITSFTLLTRFRYLFELLMMTMGWDGEMIYDKGNENERPKRHHGHLLGHRYVFFTFIVSFTISFFFLTTMVRFFTITSATTSSKPQHCPLSPSTSLPTAGTKGAQTMFCCLCPGKTFIIFFTILLITFYS